MLFFSDQELSNRGVSGTIRWSYGSLPADQTSSMTAVWTTEEESITPRRGAIAQLAQLAAKSERSTALANLQKAP
jgi:hypothetical protein